jgi:hypothetical protein
MTAYLDKGRVSPILNNVPLLAVMVEDLGVRGATKNAQIVRLYFSLSTHTHTRFAIFNSELAKSFVLQIIQSHFYSSCFFFFPIC